MSDERLHPHTTATATRTLADLVDGLRARLREPLVAMFDALDDALFDLGERAHSGDVQQRHFDALRECRKQRLAVQEQFLAALGSMHATHAARTESAERLALVDPDELEVELAIDGMAARLNQRLSHVLHALDQRMAVVLGVPNVDAQGHPLRVESLCGAFRVAAEALDIELQARLILYKLFERHVLGVLEPAYAEINVRLAAAGVLPMLGHGRVRHHATPAGHRHDAHPHAPEHATAQQPAEHMAAASGAAIARDHDEHEMLATLRELVARQTVMALSAQLSSPAPDPAQAADAMDQALTQLGQGPLAGQPLPSPRAIVQQVLEGALHAPQAAMPSAQQVATVDLLGRVFEAMTGDESIPVPMQPVVQALMLPVLRASLRNPGLIAENTHPLRQLIDLVADSAVGWCPSVDPGSRALNDLQYSLQRMAGSASAHDADHVAAQLRAQLEQQRRRSELAEQRAVEAHAGRERLWQARRQVNQALVQILGNASIPSWVRYLITRPWMNYLVLLWLRQGPTSPAYRDALGFAESLAWCAGAGTSRVEQLRMRALLPIMEAQLQQGLATVAYQDNEIGQLVNELQQYIRYRVGDLPAPAFIEAEPPAGSAPGALSADPGSVEEQPLPQNVNPEVLARVRGLRPGTWFTFADQKAGAERVKLSWVSPYSGRCLFVNRNGQKIREQRPEDLAHALEQGLANIVDGADEVLHRAISHALTRARKGDGEQGGGEDAARSA
ncbi:MAG: DUF1631 family protein [Proteobacteria bacterium]|nr:DUF1631 family protein [Pseudomonadota bacterium]